MTMLSPEPVVDKKPLSPLELQLRTSQDLFIRRWGEMGQTWGINRTMAEIHALLYITGQPQCTIRGECRGMPGLVLGAHQRASS